MADGKAVHPQSSHWSTTFNGIFEREKTSIARGKVNNNNLDNKLRNSEEYKSRNKEKSA